MAYSDLKQLKTDVWKMGDSPFVMVGPAHGSIHSEPLTAQLDKAQVDTLFFFMSRDNRLTGKDKLMPERVNETETAGRCDAMACR